MLTHTCSQIAELEAISESEFLAISFDKVPDVLRAYTHGILEHLLQHFETHRISLMVNHDDSGVFCVHVHISYGIHSIKNFVLMEVASIGVKIANIGYYKACSIASVNNQPLPKPPFLFDYADPNLLENITTTIMSIGFLIRETNHIIDNHFPSVLEDNR